MRWNSIGVETGTSFGSRFQLVLLALVVYGLSLLAGAVIGMTTYGIFVLVGLVAAFIGLLITLYPKYGLYILVFFIFTNMSDVLETSFGLPDSNKALVALLFVGTLANRIVIRNRPLVFRPTEILILMVGVVTFLSLALGIDQSNMFDVMLDWFKDFLILFIIVQLADEVDVWNNSQWVLVFAAAFLGLFSIYQIVTGDTSNDFYGLANAPLHEITEGFDNTRVSGPLADPNFYAMMQLMALPIAIYLMFAANNKVIQMIAATFAAIIFITVLITYSRGAFLGVLVVGYMMIRERRYNIFKAVLGVTFATLLFLPVMPAGFTDRLETLTSVLPGSGEARNQQENSFRGRTSELLVAVDMFEDYPIIGVGRRNYIRAYNDYSSTIGIDDRSEGRQAHSLYFEVLAEQGIIGLSIFLLMLFVVFRGGFEAKRLLRQAERQDLIPRVTGIQLGLAGYLVASIFLHGDYERYFWLIIGFNLASLVMATKQLELYKKRMEQRQLVSDGDTHLIESAA